MIETKNWKLEDRVADLEIDVSYLKLRLEDAESEKRSDSVILSGNGVPRVVANENISDS